jgi:hypothetical protein
MLTTYDELLKTATAATAMALGSVLVLQTQVLPAAHLEVEKVKADLSSALHDLMALHRPF